MGFEEYTVPVPYASCRQCESSFYVKPSHRARGWGKYCSAKCSHKGMRTGRYVKCSVCTKEIYRTEKNFKHSKSGRFFCTKSCFAVWKNSHLLVGEKHGNWKGGEYTYRKVIQKAGIMPKCSDCGISDTRVLVVHHIDQNRKNNVLSNLKWLCRNCHYLAHEGKTL